MRSSRVLALLGQGKGQWEVEEKEAPSGSKTNAVFLSFLKSCPSNRATNNDRPSPGPTTT
jgi:hypothetical protein